MKPRITYLISLMLMTNPSAYCSISTLYKDALKFDDNIQGAKGTLQQAEGQEFGSYYNFVPAPLISYTKNRQSSSFSNGSDQITHPSSLNISVNQTLSAEKVFNTLGANQTVKSARANYKAEYSNLLNNIISNYAFILSAYETLQATEAQIGYLKRIYTQEQEKYRIGSSTKANVAQAQASYDIALAQQVTQRQRIDKGLNELFSLTGQNYDRLSQLSASQELSQYLVLEQMDHYQQRALSENGSLIASKRNVEAQKLQLRSSESKFLPFFTYGLSYIKNENNENDSLVNTLDDTKIATIGIAYNLAANPGTIIYQNGAVNSAIASNRNVVTSTLANLATAYNGVNASKEAVKRYKNAVKSSKISLKATQNAYAAGSMTLLDVLNAVQEVQSNESAYAQMRYEYLTYYAQLRLLAGDNPKIILQQIDSLMEGKVNVRKTA